MKLSKKKLRNRKLVKRLLYSLFYYSESFKILFGKSNPFIRFTIENDPPCLYFNFKIKKDHVKELEQSLNLPSGFKLAKMRCITENQEDDFYMTLNIYRVSGITKGLRAEWSIFVIDPKGYTRYMIIEARADKKSMDPLNIITQNSNIEYFINESNIQITIESEGDTFFRANCKIPDISKTTFPTREWVKANDEIYWLNGISDKPFFNSKMTSSELSLLPPEMASIEDTTKWNKFLEPLPEIYLYPSTIEYLISPWWNI